MGLFDFALNIGKKLFERPGEAAEKIQSEIEAANPGIQDLKVAFNDGVVTLSGNAESRAAMEKAVLMAGNVQGVKEVVAEGLTAPAEEALNVDYYVIEKGDTLSGIAKKFYGNAAAYQSIFEANREVIRDANLIYPGQKIRIPQA